jgi:hypothetical protein
VSRSKLDYPEHTPTSYPLVDYVFEVNLSFKVLTALFGAFTTKSCRNVHINFGGSVHLSVRL